MPLSLCPLVASHLPSGIGSAWLCGRRHCRASLARHSSFGLETRVVQYREDGSAPARPAHPPTHTPISRAPRDGFGPSRQVPDVGGVGWRTKAGHLIKNQSFYPQVSTNKWDNPTFAGVNTWKASDVCVWLWSDIGCACVCESGVGPHLSDVEHGPRVVGPKSGAPPRSPNLVPPSVTTPRPSHETRRKLAAVEWAILWLRHSMSALARMPADR